MGLGLGVTAFFWLPAIMERQAIRTGLMVGNPSLDYHFNFIPLGKLFSFPFSQKVMPNLSLIAVLLALIAVAAAGVRSRSRAVLLETGWAAFFALLYSLMVLPGSVWLWDTLPLLPLFQFPHRFLGVVTILLAFLAGVGVCHLLRLVPKISPGFRGVPSPVLSTLLLLIILGLSLSHLRVLAKVRYYPPLPEIDIQFIKQKEREAAPIAGGFHTVFIPKDVQQRPPFQVMAQDGPDRLDKSSLPEDARILAQDYSPLSYRLTVASPTPFVIRFYTFYFPGWQAEVDQIPAPIIPTEPYGFISLAVLAGEHEVAVSFGSTPIRRVATAISLASLFLFGLSVVFRASFSSKGGADELKPLKQ